MCPSGEGVGEAGAELVDGRGAACCPGSGPWVSRLILGLHSMSTPSHWTEGETEACTGLGVAEAHGETAVMTRDFL